MPVTLRERGHRMFYALSEQGQFSWMISSGPDVKKQIIHFLEALVIDSAYLGNSDSLGRKVFLALRGFDESLCRPNPKWLEEHCGQLRLLFLPKRFDFKR